MSPNTPLIGQPGSRWRLQTPALVLDLDAFTRNVETMAAWAGAEGVALRPHAKSHKCVEIARRQVAAGAIGACCATVREAEMLAAAGIPGLLITTPVALAKLERIAALAAQGADIACVADNPDYVAALDGAAQAIGTVVKVFVDLDPGTGRTGVTSAGAALTVARAIMAAPGLEYAGVQAYAGHLQHIDDTGERIERMDGPVATLDACVAALREANLTPAAITGGGTGTHRLEPGRSPYTELQVGSYIFMDAQYDTVALSSDAAHPYENSLFVQASVINVNHPGYAVTDAGLKSFATDGPLPVLRRGAPPGARYAYKGDEHGAVMFAGEGDRLGLGARVECIVPHCDPNVNLYDAYHVVQGDELVGIWSVDARGNP